MIDLIGCSTQGSGFFIKNGLVATNYHVINGAKSGTVKLVDQQKRYGIEGVTVTDIEHDLEIIKVYSNNTFSNKCRRGNWL